jgi:sortase (surface protein transpeptidase)
VIAPTPTAALTLTTCDPPHTSLNRLIVRALLVGPVKTSVTS